MGASELLRVDHGGTSRPLSSIPMASVRYRSRNLKDAVSARAVIYIYPIQRDLEMAAVEDERTTDHFYSKCVVCSENIPLTEMKSHKEECQGNAVMPKLLTEAKEVHTFEALVSGNLTHINSESTCPSSRDKLVEIDEGDACGAVNRKAWTAQLVLIFLGISNKSTDHAVLFLKSLEDAADFLCESFDDKHKKIDDQKCTAIEDALEQLQAKLKS
eukprot:gene8500-9411_t